MQIARICSLMYYVHCSIHCKSRPSNPVSVFHLPLHLFCPPVTLTGVLWAHRRQQGEARDRSAPHRHSSAWSVWELKQALCWQASTALGGHRSAMWALPYQSSPSAKLLAQDKFQKCHQFAQTVIVAILMLGVGFLSTLSNFTS